MFESSSDLRCGSQKYASAAPLQVQSDWRRDVKWQKKLWFIPPTGYFCSSFLAHEALHTLFTTVYVHMYASVPGCGSELTNVSRQTSNRSDQQDLLIITYVFPPALLVECWHHLTWHTSAPHSSPLAPQVHLTLWAFKNPFTLAEWPTPLFSWNPVNAARDSAATPYWKPSAN